MLSFIANISNGIAQAGALRAQGRAYATSAALQRKQARATRNAAESNAQNIEKTSREQQELAAMNLRRQRDNEQDAIASARARQAASGFTSEGTGASQEQAVQAYFDTAVEDAALSASITTLNHFNAAAATRRQGELAAMANEMQAQQYDAAAGQAKRLGKQVLIGTGINTAVGLALMPGAYNDAKEGAEAYNARFGLKPGMANYIDPEKAALLGAGSAATWGFEAAGSINPYTAQLINSRSKDAWGGNMSILLGSAPKIPDSTYSLSGMTGTRR